MSQRSIPPALESRVAQEYVAGATLNELAFKYGCTHSGIRSALKRAGAPARSSKDTKMLRRRWAAAERAQALIWYREGWSVKRLARHFGVRDTEISDLLREQDEPLHAGGRAHPRFRTLEQCQEVAEQYLAGATYRDLAAKYDCTAPTIGKAISRAGVDPRSPGQVFWTEDRDKLLIEMHAAEATQKLIADTLDTSPDAVGRRLRAIGVLPPKTRPIGPENGRWKGGRSVTPKGYVFVYPSDEDLNFCTPHSNGYVQEHRLVMGRALGRTLTSKETVHHIDGNPSNNSLENLQLRQGNHGKGIRMTCHDCGSHNVGPAELH